MATILPFPDRKQVDPKPQRELYVSGSTVVRVTRFCDGTEATEYLTAEEAADESDLLRDLAADALSNKVKIR